MSNPEDVSPDEVRMALATAYALDQVSEPERQQVEAWLADDPALKRHVESMRQLGAMVRSAPQTNAAGSEALRKVVAESLANDRFENDPSAPSPAKQPYVEQDTKWFGRILEWGAIAFGVVVLFSVWYFPAVTAARKSARRTAAMNESSEWVDTDSGMDKRRYQEQDEVVSVATQDVVDPQIVDSELTFDRDAAALSGDPVDFGDMLAPVSGTGSMRVEGTGLAGRAPVKRKAISAHDGSSPSGEMLNIDESATPFDDSAPYERDVNRWSSIEKSPKGDTGKQASGGSKGQGQGGKLADGTLTSGVGLPDLAKAKTSVEKLLQEGEEKQRLLEIDGEVAGEQYHALPENAFFPVKDAPLSTFAIDVDTASYANIRRFINNKQMPPPSAVRMEELLNYFSYNYPAPTGKHPFAVHLEAAECPWNGKHRLVRVGLKGKEIHQAERPSSNLVFLIDTSGSMQDEDKLPLLKSALTLLTRQLTVKDRVTMVTYAGDAGLKLPPTSGGEKEKITAALDSLMSGGSTHGSAGIMLAYEQAKANFIQEGTNRVILCTDGDLNVGVTSDDALVELIKEQAKTGVYLSVMGFGTGNLKDGKLEKLADHGNGVYAYIDGLKEARKVFVEQLSGSLVTIAKDVKIQLEFNPKQVAAYRLLGYENRVMANQDFRNDKKDAGEIGAGHTVTALYEIVPVGAEPPAPVKLKYQTVDQPANQSPTNQAAPADDISKELLTVRLRYKSPEATENDAATEFETALSEKGKTIREASAGLRFASAVAMSGLVFRHSSYRGEANLDAAIEIASTALEEDTQGWRAEFVDLLRKAKALQPKGN